MHHGINFHPVTPKNTMKTDNPYFYLREKTLEFKKGGVIKHLVLNAIPYHKYVSYARDSH